MNYPNEFVDAVKTEFPDWPELHKSLDAGAENVGEYLDRMATRIVSPEHVIDLIVGGKIEELKAEFLKILRAKQLHTKWCELANASRHSAARKSK